MIASHLLENINKRFENKSPHYIISWVLLFAKRPIVTTNFGPLSASLIAAITEQKPDIPVLWVDTGFNLDETYEFADELTDRYQLNLQVYNAAPDIAAKWTAQPEVNTPEHKEFTKDLKLDPFAKAFEELQPDVWFTNIRKNQSAHRSELDIFSYNKEGILKVSPFFYWDSKEMFEYVEKHRLPNEFAYYDPTKVHANRECGLHT